MNDEEKLKLYYWNDVEFLAQYTNGDAFALASTKEEAIELIVNNSDIDDRYYSIEKCRNELKSKNPYVTEKPEGFVIYGSD